MHETLGLILSTIGESRERERERRREREREIITLQP
jgi:hypothetical protein